MTEPTPKRPKSWWDKLEDIFEQVDKTARMLMRTDDLVQELKPDIDSDNDETSDEDSE
jgi:hypothetical protein